MIQGKLSLFNALCFTYLYSQLGRKQHLVPFLHAAFTIKALSTYFILCKFSLALAAGICITSDRTNLISQLTAIIALGGTVIQSVVFFLEK